jgi:hypothetical protein
VARKLVLFRLWFVLLHSLKVWNSVPLCFARPVGNGRLPSAGGDGLRIECPGLNDVSQDLKQQVAGAKNPAVWIRIKIKIKNRT